jgi:hypothetical protein
MLLEEDGGGFCQKSGSRILMKRLGLLGAAFGQAFHIEGPLRAEGAPSIDNQRGGSRGWPRGRRAQWSVLSQTRLIYLRPPADIGAENLA